MAKAKPIPSLTKDLMYPWGIVGLYMHIMNPYLDPTEFEHLQPLRDEVRQRLIEVGGSWLEYAERNI